MEILASLFGIGACSALVYSLTSPYSTEEAVFGCMGFTAAVALLIASVAIPVNRYEVNARLAEFDAVAGSIAVARASGNFGETVTFQTQIAARNAWLARAQYANSTIWDWWIPDRVDQYKPIK